VLTLFPEISHYHAREHTQNEDPTGSENTLLCADSCGIPKKVVWEIATELLERTCLAALASVLVFH